MWAFLHATFSPFFNLDPVFHFVPLLSLEVANNHHWRLKAPNWRKTKPCCHVEVVIHRHISLLAHARKGLAFSIRTAPFFSSMESTFDFCCKHLSSKTTNFKCSSILCLLASSVGVELIIIYINHHLSACEVRSYYVVLCKMYSCTIHKLKYSLYLQVIHLSSFWLQRSSYQFFFI